MGLNPALAKKIASASASGGGNWIKHGKYRLVVDKIWTKSGFKGNSFIINLQVVAAEPLKPGTEPNQVGSMVSTSYNMDTNLSAFSLIKRFILDLTGETEASDAAGKAKQEEELGLLLTGYTDANGNRQPALDDAEQPLRGKFIDVETFDKTTAKGKEIIATNWKYVAQDDASIAAERARLEAAPMPAEAGAA